MKKFKLTILMAVSILVSSCLLVDNLTRGGLEGIWYAGDARDKICTIEDTPDGLIARNENGQTSKLIYDRGGSVVALDRSSVVALDWGGLRGEIRDNRIEWANNTYWVRGSSR
jgi:hypothetical protein